MTRKSKKGADTPAVQFDPKLMEALVPGPLTPAEANALIHGFKKALFERALGAELTHHLGYGKDEARPAGQTNHRNGTSAKTVVYVSGQIGRDAQMWLVEDTEAQTVQAFENLKRVDLAAGAALADVDDLTGFHTDMRDLPMFMQFKDRYFVKDFPARTAVGVAALGGASGYIVENKAVAVFREVSKNQ